MSEVTSPLPTCSLGSQLLLGWRGIRFCLDQPYILKTQLRAILSAPGHQIKVMLPMVGTVEVQGAKARRKRRLNYANLISPLMKPW